MVGPTGQPVARFEFKVGLMWADIAGLVAAGPRPNRPTSPRRLSPPLSLSRAHYTPHRHQTQSLYTYFHQHPYAIYDGLGHLQMQNL